jgi:microcystin-dependent protein
MNPSYVGAVWMFGGNFAPINFNFCDGSLQSISENEVLYVLLGTTYGGDGVNTFGLPDLRGRSIIGQGTGPGLNPYVEGQKSGTETYSILTTNLASHTHLLNVGTSASTATPSSTMYLNQMTVSGSPEQIYSDATPNATLIASTLGASGSNIPIDIMQPITVISYVIAMFGIFPSQN